MSLPVNKRDFDIFLSHAHKDAVFVSELDRWLTEKAGFSVWFDSRELGGGALLATDLQKAIERCRGMLLIASAESVSRGWVKAEYNSAMDERANDPAFRVVALRLPNANTDELMKGTTWIDVPGTRLDSHTAVAIVRAFYPGENLPNPATSRDAFVSCSWHGDDTASAHAVCRDLAKQGFRVIGDARDQKGFGTGNRVERIIASCGAFVAIVPFRDEASATVNEGPYKYFLREMDVAAGLGLPSIIVADPRVRREDGSDKTWLRMETDATECPRPIASAIDALWHQWCEPLKPQYVFCAMDLDSDAARAGGPIRHLVERITGMPTIVGNEIYEQPLHSAIMKKVCQAFLILADISDDNVNACIEAGMGLAAGTNVELLAQGKPRRPPFMLGSAQMPTYDDEVERVAIVHKIARRYRRRIVNAEL
jgi:TIR domain-containing protein